MVRNYLLLCLFGISTCFLASTVAREAIVGGLTAQANQFLYQVSVQIHGRGHVCGGGIIGDRFVLTAAHCILNRARQLRDNRIVILAGTNSLNNTGPPAVTRRVEKVFFPTEFQPTLEFKHGDIAVLKVRDSLQLERGANVRSLELAQNDYSGRIAMINGFGWKRYRIVRNRAVGGNDGQLRFDMPYVLPSDECERAFPAGSIQSDVHVCAKIRPPSVFDRPYGVCKGDDGGLLVHDGRTALGILSRIPHHCDERYEAGVYTRVTHYATMIRNVMERDHDSQMTSLLIVAM